MSYATNLEQEIITSQFLAVMKPRRWVLHTEFSLASGSVYQASFTAGPVYAVTVNGSSLTAGSSSSLSAGQFYYDDTSLILYVRKSDSTAVGVSDLVVATFEIYVGTFDSHWHRIPTDELSASVYFEPTIIKSPQISNSSSEVIYGFSPTKSTSIELSNADHYYEGVLYNSSFNNCEIKIWHLLGDLDEANFRLVFYGLMNNISYSQDRITINILDETNVFDQEYRHPTGSSFFAASDFPDLDPKFLGRPIRDVFGIVDGFAPVNVDYVLDGATTSDNRIFVVKRGQSNLGSVTGTVTTGSTATVTKLTSAQGFVIGDSVWFDRAVGTDEHTNIIDVDYVNNTVTHAVLSGGAMTSGDALKRSFVGNLHIIQNGNSYELQYGRDFSESTGLAADCSGFTLTNNFEATIGLPDTFSPNDIIYCRVYGDKSNETLGGGAFGSNHANYGTLCQGIVILYRILKSKLGLSESDLDTAAFTSLQASNAELIGFSVPFRAESNFPTYKELILEILKSLLLRLGKDTDNRWTISAFGPMGSPSKTIEDDEIIKDSVSYQFDYNDLVSHLVVEYLVREISRNPTVAPAESFSTWSQTANYPNYLHGVKKQMTIRTLLISASGADTFASKIMTILSERRGYLTIESKNRFFDVILGDVIRVSRDKIPGNSYSSGTNQTQDFVVIEVTKSLNKVTMVLDDQIGIENNSSSW